MLDLRGRLTSWKTNLEGIGALLVPYLVSQGYWPQDRQQWAGWLGAGAIAVWKILSKDQKANGGRPGANGGHSGGIMAMPPSWTPPGEDKSSVRSPYTPRSFLVLLLSCSLALSGCGQKTTLDRIGPIVIAGANAFEAEVNQLCNSGNLNPAKCQLLRNKIPQVKARSQQFAALLSGFGAITPDNVSALTLQFSELTSFFQGLLVDAGLDPNSKIVRIIGYISQTLIVASGVIAGIHPPAVVAATKNRGVARPNPAPSGVNLTIPKPDKDVGQALDNAGRRALKPSAYRELRESFTAEALFVN